MLDLKLRDVALATLLLAGFAAAGSGIVALVHQATEARIEENRLAINRNRIAALTEDLDYRNDPVKDSTTLGHELLGGSDLPAWFARDADDNVIGVVFSVVAPDGYNGAIRLLVGIDRSGELQGVRVSAHRETPGLGDAIEAKRSDWIHDFEGRSLGNPPAEDWNVRKDGGVFDQFTGATITPRAVVRAVYRTLQYFEQHRDDLLATRPADTGSEVQPMPQQGEDDQDHATG